MEPVILFIIIAIISSIFKKYGNRGGNPPLPLPRMADEFKEVYKEIAKSANQEPGKGRAPAGPRYREMKEKLESIEKSIKQVETTRQEKTPAGTIFSGEAGRLGVQKPEHSIADEEWKMPKHTNFEEEEPISVNGRDLAEAVIWAEILGPPRAKNPRLRK